MEAKISKLKGFRLLFLLCEVINFFQEFLSVIYNGFKIPSVAYSGDF
jgi:hypothetical protein